MLWQTLPGMDQMGAELLCSQPQHKAPECVSPRGGEGSSPVVATEHHHAVHQQELLLQVPLEGHPRAAVVGWARHCPHPQELQTRKALAQVGPSFPPLPLLPCSLLTSVLSLDYHPAPVVLPADSLMYKPFLSTSSVHPMSCQLSSLSSHSSFTRLCPVLPFLRCSLPHSLSQDTPPQDMNQVGQVFAHLHIVQVDSALGSCVKEKLGVHFIQQDVDRHSARSSIQHLKQQIHVGENVHHNGHHLGRGCRDTSPTCAASCPDQPRFPASHT